MSQIRMLKEHRPMSQELKALIERSRNTFPSQPIAYAPESPVETPPEKEVTYIPEPPEPVQWCDKVGWMDFTPFH